MRKRLSVVALLAFAIAAGFRPQSLTGGSQARVSTSNASPNAAAAPSGTVTLQGWQRHRPRRRSSRRSSRTSKDPTRRSMSTTRRSAATIRRRCWRNSRRTKAADVFYVDAADFADWVRQGVLQNLDSYVKQDALQHQALLQEALEHLQVQGSFYGFPKDWSSLGNGGQHGLLGPTSRSPDDVGAAEGVASKITVPGGKPICLSADWARLLAFVYQEATAQLKSANIGSPSGRAVELLRRPAQVRASRRRRTSSAPAGAARRSARSSARSPSRATGCSRP